MSDTGKASMSLKGTFIYMSFLVIIISLKGRFVVF